MELISHYKVFLDKKFIIEYHEGSGTLEKVMAFKLNEANDVNYSPNFDLLMDIRKTTIKGIPNDVRKYIEFALLHKGISGKRKLAVLTSSPRQVIYFTFLNMFPITLPQTMKIFSSLDAAMFWLGEPIPLNDVDSCLNNLKDKAKSYL